MSDASVAEALRSRLQRVVVEAPAGTGKTFQGASYARHAVEELRKGQRVLIVAHTHAACGVFSSRTSDLGSRVQIGTIDSLVASVAKAYHKVLDLPADLHAWSIDYGDASYSELARRVRGLLDRAPSVSGALAERHPIVICDEHQDASADQHGIVESLVRSGSRVRIFGDPMQSIFTTGAERRRLHQQWQGLVAAAGAFEPLDTAHRWSGGSPALGEWVLEQREQLRAGGTIDLRGALPRGLQVIRADNQAPRYGAYRLDAEERRPITAAVRNGDNLLVLTPHNTMVEGLNAFLGWRVPIWEGHTREALGQLVAACRRHTGDPVALGQAMCVFLTSVGIGFAPAAFGNRLVQEIQQRCVKPARGRPAEIQSIAQRMLNQPSHIGVGQALDHINHLMRTSPNFEDARIDMRREFSEARRIQAYADVASVLAMQAHQRASRPVDMPAKAISTIHKSKGLETRNAILMPCERGNLRDNEKDRCLLYVALSRACDLLSIAAPRADASPLLRM